MQSSKQGLSTQMSTPPPLKNSHAPEEACSCDEARAEGIDRDGGAAGGQAAAQLTRKEDVAELGVLTAVVVGVQGGGGRAEVLTGTRDIHPKSTPSCTQAGGRKRLSPAWETPGSFWQSGNLYLPCRPTLF